MPSLRAGLVGTAIAAATVLGTAIGGTVVAGTGVATATPAATPVDAITLPSNPLDSELAAAVRMLKAAGVDQMALQAAQAIIGATGQLNITDLIGQLGSLQAGAQVPARPVAATDPTALLRALGIQTLSPSVSPFCATPTADNPLGLVTAGAGAVPGPWPLKQDPLAQLAPILTLIPGVKIPDTLNLVDKGETAYAFVPATTGGGSGGTMQVAWFNTTTFQGGLADLKPVSDPRITSVLPLLSGVRLAPVKTGQGTVLSAVFGTAQNGNRSCFFLPAVGVINA
ncbi:hypothetical protein QSJ18_02940 [Gordonia sp. ABSL1-1]|uniref:hypothetical protein n=1 Tax=Gordonia sp. ABSL1-1 TaxID=3053923 RepID=UPI0025739CEB|nr:hypothetical protein [Gordonia sp. ABSL1-1]MDL9935692.1 hypothetical protein [Gordonia sp. ABSL1-1]